MTDLELLAQKIQQAVMDDETERRIRVWMLPDSALITTAEVCAIGQFTEKTWIEYRKHFSNTPMRFGTKGSFTYRKGAVVRFLSRIGKLPKLVVKERDRQRNIINNQDRDIDQYVK